MRRAILGVGLVCCSCGAVGFDVEQDLGKQTVQGSPLGGLLPGLLPNPYNLDIDLEAEIAKRGTGANARR